MTKAEFTDNIASRLKVKRKEAAAYVEAMLAEISESLGRGEKVQLIPFGSFEVRVRPQREGRNPRTREKIEIPEKRVPVFNPGKSLREAVGG